MGLSKEKLERLTDRSADIVVATDRKGTVVYYNDGATRSLGYSPDEILGSFVGRLYPSLEEAKRVMEVMRGPEHGGPGIADAIQTVYVAKDGTQIPVAISGTILYSEGAGAAEEDGSIGYAKDLRDILHKDQLATLGEVAVGLSHATNSTPESISRDTKATLRASRSSLATTKIAPSRLHAAMARCSSGRWLFLPDSISVKDSIGWQNALTACC